MKLSCFLLLLSALVFGQYIPVPFTAASGGGSISVVQQRGGTGTGDCNTAGAGALSKTCAFTTAPTAGHTVIATCRTYNTTCTISDNAGTDTYHAVSGGSPAVDATGCLHSTNTHKVVCIWYSYNVAGSATLKATVATSSYIVLQQYEISGLPTSGTFDQIATFTTDSPQTSPSSVGPTGTLTSANEFVLATFGFEDILTGSAGSGFTLGQTSPNSGTLGVAVDDEYKSVSSTSAVTAQLAMSGAAASGVIAIVSTFK